jgi:integrase
MLSLYRRHKRECKAGHAYQRHTSELEERKKGWKRCDCPIVASGTLQKTPNRKSTGQWEWDKARPIADAWQQSGSWTATTAPLPEPVATDGPRRITIADAVRVFHTNRESAAITPATLRKYKTFSKQFTAFTNSRGYVMLDQITPADIEVFYSGLKLEVRTKGKRLGTLRSFFRFMTSREFITKNPVSKELKPPKGANSVANKVPFTDEELERIITACDKIGTITWQSGTREGTWDGEDAKDFIWTLAYTGLRISDVALFDMKRVRGNEVFLRAKKNGGDVFAYIPDWLRDRLVARSKTYGRKPFMVGTSERLDTVTDTWRRKLNKVFALAGNFEETPTPHRFRHTFARILLERGVPVSDVADLLGDDEETVREHYSRWVPERQARLTKILQDAFADKPKPKIIAIR